MSENHAENDLGMPAENTAHMPSAARLAMIESFTSRHEKDAYDLKRGYTHRSL